jgi:hypothetical protein
LEAPRNSKSIKIESPCIKDLIYKFLKPYLLPFLRNEISRWFIFNELTVPSTRSPVKHCPISKRKIFPDSGDWALSPQGYARKICNIWAHPALMVTLVTAQTP